MKRSILWPPVARGGRISMTPHPDTATSEKDRTAALRQIIALCVLDGRSANPWNVQAQLGVNDPTFAPRTEGTRARIRAQVRRQFARLERGRRARLVDLTLTDGDPGQLVIRITYIDLETQLRQSMEITRG